MTKSPILIPIERAERRILSIRGQRVILDADLAVLYGVTTKRLNEQVKRNTRRFPEDFVFRLRSREVAEVVANCDHLLGLKFSHVRPFAFTEHGAIMAASVLNSREAIDASVLVVRAFVKLRQLLETRADLAVKLTELEQRVTGHDDAIREIVAAIRNLMDLPQKRQRERIGFKPRAREA